MVPRKVSALFGGTGLAARASRGTVLSILSFGAENALRLGGNLVLTRLLFPEIFGLMALVQVVITGLAMFSDVGLRDSIVQNRRGDDPAFLNTAWSVQIARGVLLWLGTLALAQPMADFYGEPLLVLILPIVGLNAVIEGFNSTRLLTAVRHLSLGRVTMLHVVTQAVGLSVTILLVWWLRSVWALVLGSLVTSMMKMLASHMVLSGNRDRLALDRMALKEIFVFGRWIFLSSIAGFLVAQADRAIIGKISTLDTLAFYTIAFFLATVPVLLVRRLATSVLFPLYRDFAEVTPRYRARLSRARGLLTGGGLAAAILLALIGPSLIDVLYDPRYQSAGPILVLIALASVPDVMNTGYPLVALSDGNSRLYAVLNITNAVFKTAALALGAATLGVVGVALAPALAGLVFYVVQIILLRRYNVRQPLQDLVFLAAWIVAAVVVMRLHPEVTALVVEASARP